MLIYVSASIGPWRSSKPSNPDPEWPLLHLRSTRLSRRSSQPDQVAQRPSLAVWGDAPSDPGALVNPAGLMEEPGRERPLRAGAVAFVDRQRRVGEGLHSVEKLGVSLAIET